MADTVSNVCPIQNIVYQRGTVWALPLYLTQGVGGPIYPIPTGSRFWFLVKYNALDADPGSTPTAPPALLSWDNISLPGPARLIVTSQVGGILTLPFAAADCLSFESFAEGQPYPYAIKLYGPGGGTVTDVLAGTFTVATVAVQN